MFSIINNIRRRRAAEAALKESRARFHTLVETAPALIFATDRTGRNSFVNERYQSYTGLNLQELCGDGWLSVIHPDDRIAAHSESANAQVHPRPLERRLRIRRYDGEWRWFLSRTEPVLNTSRNSSFAWLGISIDIDEQVHAEDRERLLAREVDHRAKNILAVVQSVVQLTRADDVAGIKVAINGRIQALARAHSLLASARWQGVHLRALLNDELAAFADQVEMIGEDVRLEPSAAQSMSLVIHELSTNAAKYGALSVSDGRLHVSWAQRIRDDRRFLELRWGEQGGPSVSVPTRRGFGSTLIEASVTRQLGGTVAIHWELEGLTCDIVVPTSAVTPVESVSQKVAVLPEAIKIIDLQGKRLLIVEDEALIGLQMEEALRVAGCETLGPAATVSQAVDLIVSLKPSAAIVDVNLGSESGFTVADVLLAKGIPFAFCTGRTTTSDLPQQFRNIEVLSKPFTRTQLLEAASRLILEAPLLR